MSFNEFLRDHYKAAVGAAMRSAHVPVSVFIRAPRAYICEAQHDDRLSSCAHAFIASCVHARPYYIPKAFSLIESYGLGLTNGADTCHDTNAR